MTRVEAILTVVLAIPLAGCVVGGKKAAVPVTPPAPLPVAKAEPAPPPAPLSMPQTQVTLPPVQPVNTEGMTTLQLPEPPAEATPAPKPVRRAPTPPPVQPPKIEPPAVAAPTQPTEAGNSPIEELVPEDEKKRLKDEADGRRHETKQILDQIKVHGHLNRTQTTQVKRVEAFLAQSAEAEQKGDLRLANALADRSLVMARELQNGK
jgi:hypothetical protein